MSQGNISLVDKSRSSSLSVRTTIRLTLSSLLSYREETRTNARSLNLVTAQAPSRDIGSDDQILFHFRKSRTAAVANLEPSP